MAAKRDLHLDPEYEALPPELQEKRIKLFEDSVRNQMKDKIVNVLKSNFEEEITSKDAEIDALDENLYACRAVLDRLRACIITKFYATLGQDQKPEEGFVPSLHPTIKKHMDKSMLYEEKPPHDHAVKPGISDGFDLNKSGGCIKLSLTNESASNRTCKSVSESSQNTLNKEIFGSSRFKTRYKIVVGNISKFIPVWQRNESDQSTHKWMVYIRGDKGNPDIDDVVKKVRFLLHPSYRPNDIIEINNPPFHLVKRGWGEFPVRVQLHFHDSRNKPVDIIHNLKLDKTFTGLQTLGAETVVDLQLFKSGNDVPAAKPSFHFSSFPSTSADSSQSFTSSSIESSDSLANTLLPVKMEIDVEPETNMSTSINKTNISNEAVEDKSVAENYENSVTNQISASNDIASIAIASTSNSNQAVSSYDKPQTNSLPLKSLLIKNDTTPNGVNATFVKCTDSDGRLLLVPQSSLLCIKTDKLKTTKANNNIVNNVQKTGVSNSKVIVPSYILKVVPSKDNTQKQVVLIPMSDKKVENRESKASSLQKEKNVMTNNVQEAKNIAPAEELIEEKPKSSLCWQQEIAHINLDNYKNFEELLGRVAKVFPLVKECVDRNMYPFCSSSLEEFQRWNIGKQRASEWRRAGFLRSALCNLLSKNMIPYLTKESMWSRRDIMLWCRKNGFVPMTTEKMSLLPEPKWSGVELCSITCADELLSTLKEETREKEAVIDEEEIDVVQLIDDKPSMPEEKSNQLSAFHMPPINEAALFVKDVASQIGVNIKPVELEPSICVPVIEEMMLAACRELATSLIRNAVYEGFSRVGGKVCPEEITVSDIYSAIKNKKQFNFLSNSCLGKPKDLDGDT